jgi:hypothetical protein
MSLPKIPDARYVDPRGQRFGAGLSAAVLAAAFVLAAPWLAVLVGCNLLVGAVFGTRFFLLGRPWPLLRGLLKLQPATPEHEYPRRFAQALGGIALAMGAVAFVLGYPLAGWLFVGLVIVLQTLLGVTGFCLGCRLYFLRWLVPSLFAKLFRRGDRLVSLSVRGPMLKVD